ncbi:hypothetical protein [Pinirhizobacter sp.]|jgi:hypothetical protein|uniref:hypothetical protein n=1 Tax=Pinirhizobacter sp. TaxID=2950432 RepID=UPI002F3E6A1B
MSEKHPIDGDERELARLYGTLPQATPSPALDEAVLRQAREAVPAVEAPATANPGRMPRRGLRWAGGLAIAASLVLAANLAWQQRQLPAPRVRLESARDKAEPIPAASVGENGAASGAVSAPQTAPTGTAGGEVTARKVAPPQPVREKTAIVSQARNLTTAEGYVTTLPAPATRSAAAQGRDAPAAPRFRVTPPPPPPVSGMDVSEPAPAPALPSAPAPPAPPAMAADAVSKASAPAPAAAPAPAPAPPAAEPGSALPAQGALSQELAEPARPSIDQRRALEAITVTGSRSDAEPRRRVAVIRQMLRDGHEASARKAYANLRRDFPGFVIPRDLAPLAK